MIIVDGGLTAEEFRANSDHRQALAKFLKSETGALLLYILNEGSQPITKPHSLPQDRLEELHASEYRANMGWRKCVSLIKSMAEPLEVPEKTSKADPKALGVKRTEEELQKKVPKFEVPSETTKNTPPTT